MSLTMTRQEATRARWALAAMFAGGGMLVGAWAPRSRFCCQSTASTRRCWAC